jgi:putative ABC transport system permease protein
MEDSIQKAYGHVTLVGGIISFFAVLSLILACMGLLGSVTYSVSTKVKEIGVRKVLGASTQQVIFQLSKRFLLLLALAIVIALPLGYLASSKFLTIFAYRIDLNGVILGGSAAAMLLLGLLTIGLQASRAALANPVEALRSE